MASMQHAFPSAVNCFQMRYKPLEIEKPCGEGSAIMQFFNQPHPPSVDLSRLSSAPGKAKYDDSLTTPHLAVRKKANSLLFVLTSSLLVSSDGTPIPADLLYGKKLLICCFLVPVTNDSLDADFCLALIEAYAYFRDVKNCEVVIVAKMRSGFEDNKDAFKHFISAFPCPAVSFDDRTARDFICKSVGLTCFSASLLLSERNTVLKLDCKSLSRYGATSFPFSASRLATLDKEDRDLSWRLNDAHTFHGEVDYDHIYVSLEEVLGLPASCSLQNLSGEETSLSQLRKRKCVAVYACRNGRFMEELHQVHQQCVAAQLDFEVVLVCTPLIGNDPKSFVDDVKLSLEKGNILSWWYLPPFYDGELTRRLRRSCTAPDDQVVVFVAGEKGVLGDCKGLEVMSTCGGVNAYPFTRQNIIDEKLSYLRSLRLPTLLWGTDPDACLLRFNKNPRAVPMADVIDNKKILLYFDYSDAPDLYPMVFRCYKRIQKDFSDSEVVFVPLEGGRPRPGGKARLKDMSWPILPQSRSASVINTLFFKKPRPFPYPCVVAFDANGQLLSICAEENLSDDGGVDASLFDDQLVDEVVYYLGRSFRD